MTHSYPTIEDAIGRTPLVALQRIGAQDHAERGNVVLGKLEGNNPAGSVKDRPALSMIRRAEERGEIRPGDTLIEATSGNTGIALAMAAAIKGKRDARCSLDRTLHGIEVMTAILSSGETGKFITMKTTCTRPKALGPDEARALLK